MTEKDLLDIVFKIEDNKKDKIDIRELLSRYLRNWYWFVLALALFGILAFTYLQYATPQYAISSKILIKEDKNGPDPSGAGVFKDIDLFNNSKNVLNEIEALKSQSLIERVLRELSLSCSYFLEGNIKDREIYGKDLPIRVIVNKMDPKAYEKQFFIKLKDNKSFEFGETNDNGNVTKWEKYDFDKEITKPYANFSIKSLLDITKLKEREKEIIIRFNDISVLAKNYLEDIEIELVNEDAAVVQLELKSAIPEKGKDILNTLVELYNKENVEDKNLIAANTVKFIDERLDYLMSDLTGVEKSVEAFKKDNELTDVSSEASMYREEASDYNKQLAEIELNLDVLNSIETYLENRESKYSLVPGSISIPDPTLQEPISKFNELLLERQRMLRTLPEENPLVQNLDGQLTYLRSNISQNLDNVKRNLLIKKKNIRASSRQFASRIGKVPTMERQLLEINRQQGVKEKLYLYLLQKKEESSLSVVSAVSNFLIIDSATSSIKPVDPKKKLIYAFAVLMAICAPIGVMYVKDITDNKVRSRKEVEKITKAPILGELPHSEMTSQIIVTAESRYPIVEVFRLMRSNLGFLSLGKRNQVIMVTSSMSGEGKTFFSINFGASMALLGKKVLIMDFDLRKPNVSKTLKLPKGNGIADYLASDVVAIDEIVTPVDSNPNLSVIGSGTVPPNPNELMASEKVGRLIERLRDTYEYIIIDTAPVGLVADALSLSPYIDSSIYMVRYDTTYKSQLDIIRDIHENKKLKNSILVLNDKKDEANAEYTYGHYGADIKS